jgi:hypothetical protein
VRRHPGTHPLPLEFVPTGDALRGADHERCHEGGIGGEVLCVNCEEIVDGLALSRVEVHFDLVRTAREGPTQSAFIQEKSLSIEGDLTYQEKQRRQRAYILIGNAGRSAPHAGEFCLPF